MENKFWKSTRTKSSHRSDADVTPMTADVTFVFSQYSSNISIAIEATRYLWTFQYSLPQKTLSFLVTGDNNRVFWCVGWKMWAKRLKERKSERKRERIKHILLNLISSASTLYMYAHVWESHTKRKREIVWLSRLPFIKKKKYFFSL